MGPALADGRPDFEAGGSEWRTPPLWGIGLWTVNQHSYFLHDGRARGLLEAVLFHGGEAGQARDEVLPVSRGRARGADRIFGVALMTLFPKLSAPHALLAALAGLLCASVALWSACEVEPDAPKADRHRCCATWSPT